MSLRDSISRTNRWFIRPMAETPFEDEISSSSESEDAPVSGTKKQLRNVSAALYPPVQPVHLSDVVHTTLRTMVPWLGTLVWPLMMAVPLMLSSSQSCLHYRLLFPESWYSVDEHVRNPTSPKPLGLCLGILAVAVGQFFVFIFFYLHKFGYLGGMIRVRDEDVSISRSSLASAPSTPISIQTKGPPVYDFFEGLQTHLSQPEGFIILTGYLALTWRLRLLPLSYYSFEGSIQWKELLLCLVVQDGLQYVSHRLEHVLSPAFYRLSHKPHHRFTNPRLFDAFNGSLADTVCMIIVPLFVTAHIVRTCNVWTYMGFGSTYACWLTLIHSELVFPWDCTIFRPLGLGTPADHHVHHKFFKFNYGHLFMWFDQISGTYRDPQSFAPKVFNSHV
jgi:alternative squalene epoxidase